MAKICIELIILFKFYLNPSSFRVGLSIIKHTNEEIPKAFIVIIIIILCFSAVCFILIFTFWSPYLSVRSQMTQCIFGEWKNKDREVCNCTHVCWIGSITFRSLTPQSFWFTKTENDDMKNEWQKWPHQIKLNSQYPQIFQCPNIHNLS